MNQIKAPHRPVRSVNTSAIVYTKKKIKSGRFYSRLKGETPQRETPDRIKKQLEKARAERLETARAIGRAAAEMEKGRFMTRINKDGQVFYQDNTRGFGKAVSIDQSLAIKLGLVQING